MTWKHGRSGYRKRGCRCDVCRAANAAWARERRRRRRELLSDGAVAPQPHGISTYINWGCRCDECCAAQAVRLADIRPQRKAEDKRRNDVSRDSAWNHGQPWTGAELEVACRRDLSARAVAAMLGRTEAAVQTIRQSVNREDPKVMAMLGKLYR